MHRPRPRRGQVVRCTWGWSRGTLWCWTSLRGPFPPSCEAQSGRSRQSCTRRPGTNDIKLFCCYGQIVRFFKCFWWQFFLQYSPKVCPLFGLFWKHPFFCITWCRYFLGNFWKIVLLFIPVSGRTAVDSDRKESLLMRLQAVWPDVGIKRSII